MAKIKKRNKEYNKIIDKIQKVRKKNNKNWMDILRVAFSHAPNETKKLIKEILKSVK